DGDSQVPEPASALRLGAGRHRHRFPLLAKLLVRPSRPSPFGESARTLGVEASRLTEPSWSAGTGPSLLGRIAGPRSGRTTWLWFSEAPGSGWPPGAWLAGIPAGGL